MRIDKFLWCVRLAKTRSAAQKLCTGQQIQVMEVAVKPAHILGIGDEFSVKAGALWRRFKVLDIPKSRVGAKLVPQFLMEMTEADVLERIESLRKINRQNRLVGIVGRPTKKQRRKLEDFSNQNNE